MLRPWLRWDITKAAKKPAPRASDGRFGTHRTAPPAKGKTKGGAKGHAKAKPKAPAKPKKPTTDAERAAASASVMQSMNIAPESAAALQTLATGGTADPKALASAGFEQAGLVARAADGSYQITPAGLHMLTAAQNGDGAKAGQIVAESRAKAQATARAQDARAKTKAAAAAARAKAKADAAKAKAQAAKAKANAKHKAHATHKAAVADMATLFIPFDLEKAEQRIVEGIASTDAIDNQPGEMDGQAYVGDVVDPAAIEGALADYLKWANVREMHQPSAVGTAIAAQVVDGQLRLAVKVVDDSAWQKVVNKVYKGFSIGGRALKAVLEQLPDGRYIRRILKLMLTEISLVDRPANPEARILVFKGIDMPDTETQELPASGVTSDQLALLQQLAGTLTLEKAASDPTKIVAMIQQARNEAELGGDLDGASLYTQAIGLILQAAGEAEEPAPDDEAAVDDTGDTTTDDTGAMTMALAASAPLQKAGRMMSGSNMAAVEGVWKALGEMLVRAGNQKVAAVMKAYGADDADNSQSLAMVIGAELTKALQPIARAMLSVVSDVEMLKRQPAPGGPILRQVAKQIAGTGSPAQLVEKAAKPQASQLVREQMDALLRKAHTDPNPAFRVEYRKQYDALREQYA